MEKALLITMPISHFCERARWSLDRAGIEFEEQTTLQFFHRLALRKIGAGQSVPALKLGEKVLVDSNEILAWIQSCAGNRGALGAWAKGDSREQQMLAWGESVAVNSRLLLYHWVLPHKKTLLRTNNRFAPAWQGFLLRMAYPLAVGKLKSFMSVSEAAAERAYRELCETLDWIESKIEHARYLYLDSEEPDAGKNFSALDLTLASYLAPLAMPPEYGISSGYLPGIMECPPEMRKTLTQLRDRPAIQWVLEIYRMHRREAVSNADSIPG